MKELFGWAFFWCYYSNKKITESKRDLKLEQLYKHIFISNVLLFFILLMGFMGLSMYINSDDLLQSTPLIVFLILVITIFQIVFQIKTCLQAMKRNLGIESFRKELKEGFTELALISSALVKGVATEAVENLEVELKKIWTDFFGEYEGDSQSKYNYYTKEESTFEHNKDFSNEIIRIYTKYDISHDADINTIKKQFRSLAKKYHPDMPTGNERKFIELRDDMDYLIQYINRQKSA